MNAEGLHLSNQEYSVLDHHHQHQLITRLVMQVCIRSERGFCGISYTACADMVRRTFSNRSFFDRMMLRCTTSPRVSPSARQALLEADHLL